MKKLVSLACVCLLAYGALPTDALAQKKGTKKPAPKAAPAPKPVTKASGPAKTGDKYFDNEEYYTAAEYYKKAIEDTPNDLYAQYKLAESYRNYFDYSRAEETYYKVVQADVNGTMFPLAAYRHAEMLKINGKYNEAKAAFEAFPAKFKPAKPADKVYADQALVEAKGCELAVTEFGRTLPDYQFGILPPPVNSSENDFAAVPFLADTVIVLTSSRKDARGSKDPRFGQNFADLFRFKKNSSGGWDKFEGKDDFADLNTKVNDGAGVFNRDKTKFYYTSCSDNDVCRLYVSYYVDGVWKDPQILNANINAPNFSSKQPALSRDGDTLYFVSDRPGGKGGNDIWYSVSKGQDDWQTAVNYEAINTPYTDMAPSVYYPENLFFFASNGREGLGGLDIYVAYGAGRSTITNLGLPFNSNRDDFYFQQGEQFGFLTSNRTNGIGNDDIYMFNVKALGTSVLDAITKKEAKKPAPVAVAEPAKPAVDTVKKEEPQGSKDVVAEVVDPNSNKPKPNTEVDLLDDKGKKVKSGKTDKDGKAKFANLDPKKKYTVKPTKVKPAKESDAQPDGGDAVVAEVKEKKSAKPVRRFLYENVYFDFNSSDLRPEARKTLDEVYTYISNNPDAQIEMAGYADAIGSPAYNQALSQRRSEAARDYLAAKGMDNTKLVVKAFGEDKPLSLNDNNTGRQLNRRVEFYVLGGIPFDGGSMAYIPEEATTVAKVAAQFGMSETEVRELNALSSDEIAAYQPLRVKKSGKVKGAVAPATQALGGRPGKGGLR